MPFQGSLLKAREGSGSPGRLRLDSRHQAWPETICSAFLDSIGDQRKERRLTLMSVLKSVICVCGHKSDAIATPLRRYSRGIYRHLRSLRAIGLQPFLETVSRGCCAGLCGMIPINLPCGRGQEHRGRKRNGTPKRSSKDDARMQCLAILQERWDSSSKGRWTHTLIPTIRPWIERFGHEAEPYCLTCGEGMVEDAEHAPFRMRDS
ncbi:uncharacterized protein [Drosophila tropicalis]|uniref:uncharacterized protein n=1 Tax=Drosophila tropicalis TaxID=46794 RepID=UPI0035AC2178